MMILRCTTEILLALALLFPALLHAQDKPAMAVEFQIEAPTYQRNLHKEVESTEKDLEWILASIGNKEFGFLSWQPFDPAQEKSLAAVLSVHMVEGEPGHLGSSIWLKLSAQPKGQSQIFDCYLERPVPVLFAHIGAVQLYSGSWPQPGEAAKLKDRVGKVLAIYFENGRFRQGLFDAVLSQIPLCHDVKLFPGPFRNRLALAIEREKLQLDAKSKMMLRPCSRLPSQGRADGEIHLEPARSRIYEGEVAPLVQTKVFFCDFDPWEGEECMRAIPLILQHRLTGGLDIFMMQYVPPTQDGYGNRTTSPWKG